MNERPADGVASAISVYLDGRPVGTLTSPLPGGRSGSFTYAREVLGDQTAAVSLRLPGDYRTPG